MKIDCESILRDMIKELREHFKKDKWPLDYLFLTDEFTQRLKHMISDDLKLAFKKQGFKFAKRNGRVMIIKRIKV